MQAVTDDPFVATVQDPPAAGTRQAFGPLLRRIMIDQFSRALFGPQGNWWEFAGATARYPGTVAGTTLADVINANTGAQVREAVFLLPGVPRPRLVKPAAPSLRAHSASGSMVDDVATAATADEGFRPTRR